MKKTVSCFLDELLGNYPSLSACEGDIVSAFDALVHCFRHSGKVLVCGNGGSAADAQHIVGELMKGYLRKRRLPDEDVRKLEACGLETTVAPADALQGALPALSLVSEISLGTAYANDVDAAMAYAQQVYGYGTCGDVLLGISTSGNSKSVANAVRVARIFGLVTLGLTGGSGGELATLCDISICVPAEATWRIQEFHQPIYHALCAMLEEEFFG